MLGFTNIFNYHIEHDIKLEFSKEYFSDFCVDNPNVIHDKEWSDLNMDDVFIRICTAYTTPGEHILYKMLRSPLQNRTDLRQRQSSIDKLSKSKENLDSITKLLKKLGYQDYGNILSILNGNLPANNVKKKRLYYFLLGIITPILILLFVIYLSKSFFLLTIPYILINTIIHFKIENYLEDSSQSLSYLGKILMTAINLCNNDYPEIKYHNMKLKQLIPKIKPISNNFKILKSIDTFNDFNEISYLLSIFTLSRERSYYRSIESINSNIASICEAYEIVGEIDALISIINYRNSINGEFCTADFSLEETLLIAKGLRNPLIDNCVPNDIELIDTGVILTGSNMAGKSTFLRTLGINIIFSRTICTCLASEFKSSFFNLFTSILSEDNINEGKSYYLSEAESILNIINGLSLDSPSFCIIDEIFKGTNPIERIASATEILNYLSKNNTITVVATHDKELTDLVTTKYDCYYFSEDVDEENGLHFDYKLKKGISPSSNAIKLLSFLNYPEEIINGALKQVKIFNSTKLKS